MIIIKLGFEYSEIDLAPLDLVFRFVPSFATPPLLNACSLEMRRGKLYIRKPPLLSIFDLDM